MVSLIKQEFKTWNKEKISPNDNLRLNKLQMFHGMFDASFYRAIAALKRDDHKNILRQIKDNVSLYFDSTLSEKIRFASCVHLI